MSETGHCYKCGATLLNAPGIGEYCPNRHCDVADATSGVVGKITQLTPDPAGSLVTIMEPNKKVRELENQHIKDQDALAEMAAELRRQREHALRWIRERGYRVVPAEPTHEMTDRGARESHAVMCKTNSPRTHERYSTRDVMDWNYKKARITIRAALSAIDQDDIEKDLMK